MAQLTHPGLHAHEGDWPLRPSAAARAMGAIGVCLAALGLVTAPFLALRLVSGAEPPMLTRSSPQAVWILLASLLSTGLSLYLLIVSVASLGLRRWSRKGFITYGIASLVIAAICAYPFLRWLGVIGDRVAAVRGPSSFIILIGWLFSIPYAILVLVVMTRPRTREAFDGPKPEAP